MFRKVRFELMARNMYKSFCEIKMIKRVNLVVFNCNTFITIHKTNNAKFK